MPPSTATKTALDRDDAVEREGGRRDHAAAGLDDQLRGRRQVLARGADQRVEVGVDRRRRGRRRSSARRARRRGRRSRTRRARRSGRRCPRTARRRGSASRRARAGRACAAAGCARCARSAARPRPAASPNFEPSCPVSTCAWVSAVTPGITRTSTSCSRPVASRRSTSSALSTTTRPIPCSAASAISSSVLALPWWTISAGSTPAFSAVRISPPPATSSPSPSSTITRWTAVAGKALEAKTTRERGQRAAQRLAVLARPRPQRGLVDDQGGRAELARERVGAAAADRRASRPRRARSTVGRARAERPRAASYSRVARPRLRGKSKMGAAASWRVPCRAMSVIDRFRLDGKVAVVTGASSGLGAAFATGLAEAGADIAICARRADRLQQTAEQVRALGRRCHAVTADVALPEDCTRVIEETVRRAGPRRRADQQRRHRHRRARHARDPGASSGA